MATRSEVHNPDPEEEDDELFDESENDDVDSTELDSSTDSDDENDSEVDESDSTGDDEEGYAENGDPEESDGLQLDADFNEKKPKGDKGDNSAIRQMRKRIEEINQQNRLLQQQLAQVAQPQFNSEPEPTFESVGYDPDKYVEAKSKWAQKQAVNEQFKQQQIKEQQTREQNWNSVATNYVSERSKVKNEDFKDAESTVEARLSPTQQQWMLLSSLKPVHLVYALGRNDKKLENLAKITDPFRFAAEIARLENVEMKTGSGKPAPERRPLKAGGSVGSGARSTDTKRDKLIEDVQNGVAGAGDKLRAYNRAKKAGMRK